MSRFLTGGGGATYFFFGNDSELVESLEVLDLVEKMEKRKTRRLLQTFTLEIVQENMGNS
jgi:hypothetical protein